ncbi:MAG: C-terminal binding protein [Spirochaetota bacterium]
MSLFKVYVTEKSYDDYSAEKAILSRAGAMVGFARCNTEDDIIHQCRDAHGLLVRQTPVGEKALKELKNLVVISRYGCGYDNIDIDAATHYGVVVTVVPDYCTGEVADHAIALLLSCIRKILPRDRAVRTGGWDLTSTLPVARSYNRIMGLVGYGKTAREVRNRLSGFPFRFAACDPYIPPEIFEMDRTIRLDFDKLIMVSDYISIHLPLTRETHHLFNLNAFKKMRRGAILVNTSRGQVINTAHLCQALHNKYISAAALDVFEQEPFDPSHPLAGIDSVVLSDHASWYSEQSQKELQQKTAAEAARVLTGHLSGNLVNPSALEVQKPAKRQAVVL